MTEPTVHDLSPTAQEFLSAVRAGLTSSPKTLPCKFLYDETGAILFEAICTLDSYYPTRTEQLILDRFSPEMARAIGPRARVVEPGAGSLTKVKTLLGAMEDPAEYVPIDIAMEQLDDAATNLAREFPGVLVKPVCADFTKPMDLPEKGDSVERTVVFYPGSTIGNFEPEAAIGFLERMRRLAGDDGHVLLGVDLAKDQETLRDAYDDPAGVTAAFNKNLLSHINRELGADFDVREFQHRVRFETDPNRVVLSLISKSDQTVRLDGEAIEFRAGEEVVTEYSHKPTIADFTKIAAAADLEVLQSWTDDNDWFSVHLLKSR
ncbi:MAG: L-histidine N(alpha)-methyltransferase [Planctomycetota bacterium]